MILNDVRFALRTLRKNPAFAVAAILTLALGIGASTAIFSVVRGVLLRPLDYGESDRLVAVFASERNGTEPRNPTTPAAYHDLRERSKTLEQITAARSWSPTLTGADAPFLLHGLKASTSLFDLLGVSPALGRTFADGANTDGHVVVLGHDLWMTVFAGDRGIVGRSIVLDGEGYTVLGVMPPGFQFPPFWATDTQLWVPLVFSPAGAADREAAFLRVFARLRPGVELSGAQDELARIGEQLAAEHPGSDAGIAVRVEQLREPVVSTVRPTVLVTFGAVVLVFLIACSNVASLLLGRMVTRRGEIALRGAIGADRRRLVQQLLVESLVLAVLGGAVGLLLAAGLVDLLLFAGMGSMPRATSIRLDGVVATYAIALSFLTAAVCGLVPAFRQSGTDPAAALRARYSGDRLTGWTRRLLAGFEIALSLALLVGAGLLLESLHRLQQVDPGFDSTRVETMQLSLSGSMNATPERQGGFYSGVIESTVGMAGVRAAALVNHLPVSGDRWRSRFVEEGHAGSEAEDGTSAIMRTVSDRYFETMGIPLLRGRPFGTGDRRDSEPVVIVSSAMATRLWPGGEAIGQRVRGADAGPGDPWLTVVGVVGDTRQEMFAAAPDPEIYYPISQNPFTWFTSATLVIRHEPAWAGSNAVAQQIWVMDSGVPISAISSMERILAQHLGPQRFSAVLISLFALVALLLAVVGVVGVIGYLVAQRTHEIAVRVALGARTTDVMRLVMKESLVITGGAVLAGLLTATILTRFLTGMLFGVAPTEPVVFIGATLAMAAVATTAAILPARRAMRIPPIMAIRSG